MTIPVATSRDTWRHARRLLAPHRRQLALLGGVVLVGSVALLSVPLVVRQAIDDGVRSGDVGVVDRAALLLVGLAVVAAALSHLRVRISGRIAEAVLADLRTESATRVLGLSVGDLRGATRGDVIARLTGDVETLTEAVREGVPELVRNVALLLVAVAVLFVVSPLLAVVGLAGVLVVGRSGRVLFRRTRPIYAAYRAQLGSALGVLGESVAGVRVVQAYGREDERAAHYAEHNRGVTASYLEGMRARNRFYPVLIVCQTLSIVGVVLVGAALVSAGRVSVGTVAASVLATASVFRPVEDLADWADHLQTARAALSRVAGLLDLEPVVQESADVQPLPADGRLEMRGVSFAYGDDPDVLRDVDLVLEPGERLALVGPTGAGKSTLGRVLARLDDPSSGTVTYGGVDLRDATLSDVRRRVVLTPQEGHLVRGTVAENVRLARPDASDDEVTAALDRIGALSWVKSLPAGIDTEVEAAGTRLSAGERQLVALARVALADPRVVVLDEATSALDLGTELLVERALARVLAGRTVVVVAHRATTAARADRVAVMSGGRIAEIGSHVELIAAGGEYANLWSAWTRTA